MKVENIKKQTKQKHLKMEKSLASNAKFFAN